MPLSAELQVMQEKTLVENYKRICYNVSEAAEKYRGGGKIRIMGVTKTVAPELVNKSIELGIDLIGENRVQEYLSKKDFYKPCEMHIIGHLQTNKVKYIINDAACIQSVDSLRLAEEINRQAEKTGKVQDILLEVNIGREQSKSGVAEEDLSGLLGEISGLSGVRVRGLMAIPPIGCGEELFEHMRDLFERHKGGDFDTLSMGMSGDYVTAVKHGSTLIRLGTALYGARIYK